MELSEEEVARREATRAALRRALSIEINHAAVNAPLIQSDWIQRLRTAKRDELMAKAAEFKAEHLSRARKQAAALRSASRSLQSLHTEIGRAQGSQCDALASIVTLFENNIQVLADKHIAALQTLAREVQAEEAAAAHPALLEKLAKDVAALQESHSSTRKHCETVFNGRKREILDFWDEAKGLTTLLGEEGIRALAVELKQVKESTLAETKEDRARHKQLFEEDSRDTELIASRGRRLEEVQKEIENWQERLLADAVHWQQEVSAAMSEKSEALQKYSEVQKGVGEARKRHEKKMKSVSSASGAAETELETIVAAAERVVKMLEMKQAQIAKRDQEDGKGPRKISS